MDVADVENLKDKWFCRECSYKQQQGNKTTTPGLFQQLMESLLQKNPKAFQLPENIRTFFEGANNGDIEIITDDSDDDILSDSASDEEMDEDDVEKVLSYGGLVYRLPAKAIKLDFMDYAKKLRDNDPATPRRKSASPSSQSHCASDGPGNATEEEAREWLEGLSSFQTSVAEYLKDDLTSPDGAGLRMLVRAALNDERSPQQTKVEIDEQRYKKCLAIEKLMQLKGEDALMKILTKD
ncbi:hypothetical protein DFQ29_005500 [Apophysomyces sp. BC1021]|nr:hypothetical protein DFQ29_005500 [Apophysomyces sp. BC1021]